MPRLGISGETWPQGTGAVLAGLPEDERCMSFGPGATGIADASELWIEVLLRHVCHRYRPDGEARWRRAREIQDGVKQDAGREGGFLMLTPRTHY
jgi:hypothetical protein